MRQGRKKGHPFDNSRTGTPISVCHRKCWKPRGTNKNSVAIQESHTLSWCVIENCGNPKCGFRFPRLPFKTKQNSGRRLLLRKGPIQVLPQFPACGPRVCGFFVCLDFVFSWEPLFGVTGKPKGKRGGATRMEDTPFLPILACNLQPYLFHQFEWASCDMQKSSTGVQAIGGSVAWS